MLVGSTRAETVIEQKPREENLWRSERKVLIDTKEEEDSIAYRSARRTDMQKRADQVK